MSEYSIPNLPLLPVVQDIPVAAEYWEAGAQFPAIATFTRWERFELYRDMYDGDWSAFGLRDLEIVDNYFASIPDFWADLMLSWPPMLTPENEMLQSDLKAALHEAVVDYFRYGVALLYAYTSVDADGAAQPRIECIDPRLWFPMPGGMGDVILRFQEGRFVDVAVLPMDGMDMAMRFGINEISAALADLMPDKYAALQAAQRVAPFACTLGQMVEQQTYPGSPGRSVFPVARRPVYGDWGTSIYPYIASMVFEYSRRASDIGVVLSEHTFPVLTLTGEPMAANPSVGMLDDAQQQTEGEKADQSDRRFRYQRRRGERVTLPDGMGMEYVVWDAAMESQFEQEDRMQQAIFLHTDTPQTLFGINTQDTPTAVSGEALRRTFIPTYLKSRQLQVQLLGAINGCLAALGMENVKVDWPEPLEQIDTATKSMAMPPMVGGESDGEVEGDEEGGEDDAEMEMRDEPDEGGA